MRLFQSHKKGEKTDLRLQSETEEEKAKLEEVATWPLFPMRQPGNFPRFYELRTLPANWATPASSERGRP